MAPNIEVRRQTECSDELARTLIGGSSPAAQQHRPDPPCSPRAAPCRVAKSDTRSLDRAPSDGSLLSTRLSLARLTQTERLGQLGTTAGVIRSHHRVVALQASTG